MKSYIFSRVAFPSNLIQQRVGRSLDGPDLDPHSLGLSPHFTLIIAINHEPSVVFIGSIHSSSIRMWC